MTVDKLLNSLMTNPRQAMTYSQNSMTGERMPSASAQLPFRRSWVADRFDREVEERRAEGVTEDDDRADWAALRLWQARRKSCVQLGVFQGCPQVAQGNGLVKE